MATYSSDFLVVGSGLAGLNAALLLAKFGSVTVVTKRRPIDSSTNWAQGGIASVMDKSDSFDEHKADTLEAGAGLCDEAAVESVVADGPKAVERLISLGVEFDQRDGAYDLTQEGGHSKRRILHAQDITGREIARVLNARAQACEGLIIRDDHIAIDLITESQSAVGEHNRCVGAYVLNSNTGEVDTYLARATLLATGGAGKVYLYTSNPDVAAGDGVAMAVRAGAEIANMEFFQFHPTCLYHPRAKSFLISEALRGEGGILRRQDGEAFMADQHPLKDLAPRDIVARAIDRELKRTGDDYVGLDMTSIDAAFLVSRFPNIHAACLALGIDMTQMSIPVVPAAHYMCGGVKTDLFGRSSVPGLFVAGETSCTGLHGANRLASNSLLEAAVISERAAGAMQEYAAGIDDVGAVQAWDSGDAVTPDEEVIVSHNWDELRRAMWSYVGIVRTKKRLERAARRIELLRDEIQDYYWTFHVTHNLVELRNLVTVADLIVRSAQLRGESRGLHYNSDFGLQPGKELYHTILKKSDSGGVIAERRGMKAW